MQIARIEFTAASDITPEQVARDVEHTLTHLVLGGEGVNVVFEDGSCLNVHDGYTEWIVSPTQAAADRPPSNAHLVGV